MLAKVFGFQEYLTLARTKGSEHVHHVSASAGPLTFVGGAGDFGDDGAIRHAGDLDAQLDGALANIADALAAESCTLDDLVRLHVYFTDDRDDWHRYRVRQVRRVRRVRA